MGKRWFRVWLFLQFPLFGLSAEAAVRPGSTVRIVLNDGTVVLGEVVAETQKGLTISNGGATRLVLFASVRSVEDLTPKEPAPLPVTPQPPAPAPIEPAPARAPPPEPPKLFRLGAGLNVGAHLQQVGPAILVGAEAVFAFELSAYWSLRVVAQFTHVEPTVPSIFTETKNVGLVMAMPIFWYGIYGLGVAVGIGYGEVLSRQFNSQSIGGLEFGLLASPVRLRFGRRVTHEVSLEVGVPIHSVVPLTNPFGRLSYTILF